MDKDKPDFADFVTNLPASGSWGAAAWVGNFSHSYVWKQNTEQGLALRAAQIGLRPWGLQLQARQACPLPPCWRQSQKLQLIFPTWHKPGCPLAGRVTKPHQSTLGPTVPSLMDVVPHWHPPTQTYQETFPATENSLNGSWCRNAAGGDLGCYI